MKLAWKLYRLVCVLQMTVAAFILLTALFNFFKYPNFGDISKLLLFLLIMLLSIFAVNTLNNNYPDTPITGKQKKTFNRLFLANFLFLAVLFGLIIAEFRAAKALAKLLDLSFSHLPFEALITLFTYLLILISQFIILYGLSELRRLLYVNFMKRKFEFEAKT